jgi:hypothetical protein
MGDTSGFITDFYGETASYDITAISLLPYLDAAWTNQYGYLFVPDGSGALINFNNGKQRFDSYSEAVYGSDEIVQPDYRGAVKESVRLPVFGMKNGTRAYLGVVTHGEGVTDINADVSNRINSYNYVYPTMNYKYLVKTMSSDRKRELAVTSPPVILKDYAVRYYFLEADKASYSGMARRYQKYLAEEKGLKKKRMQAIMFFHRYLWRGGEAEIFPGA